ncbi:hypothetical protein F2Q68_00043621 [Brassica cretica]|uniref:Uncharacterized protein n=1 Tax=Brassica cretica TaxID=69181 RepID=A0A8S9LJJ1_BRACR|nr:hypothetical protein F2Q68_00043621 [Brassica cretica]
MISLEFTGRVGSTGQIEDKVESGADDPKIERKTSIVNDRSEDESVLSQAWTRDSLSHRSLSSTSNSSFGSPRRDSEMKKKKKKILPYGIISPSDTKPGAGNDEKAQEEKLEKKKSNDQENSKLLKPQGNDKETSSTREKERISSFQRPKLLDYDEAMARLAALRRR